MSHKAKQNDTFAMHTPTHISFACNVQICLYILQIYACNVYLIQICIPKGRVELSDFSVTYTIVKFSYDARALYINEIENYCKHCTTTFHPYYLYIYSCRFVFSARSLHFNGPFKWMAYQLFTAIVCNINYSQLFNESK